MLSTPWSRDMGLRAPIVNAPMGGVAGGRLAAAVTAAGGLGMIGMGSAGTVAALTGELELLGEVSGPFGIGLVDWVLARESGLLDTALAARPALISIGFTDDFDWVNRLHRHGVAAATQVYDAEQARRAADAGVDVLVARGAEGGGHGEPLLGTLPLLDAVLDAVDVPVLAAGGISTGRSLAAVLAAGAAGAWMGTRLSICAEALTPPGARAALARATATDTVATRVFDIAQNLTWPARFPSRVLRNDFTRQWAGREADLARTPAAHESVAAAMAADDPDIAPVDAGQGVGVLVESAPARAIIDDLCATAQRCLRGVGTNRGR
ncbi:NAD(P)H-dependent flavin oxidoreductase [Nocardia sp. CA-290969]|uniref:NAD(P)H-dependent flavin oxidoreductase n=1 Tax=Nocardia sp. CA-290969 TaxID=3239986 RepID=UPI003D94E880